MLNKANCDELNNSNVHTKAAQVTRMNLLSRFQGRVSSQKETFLTKPDKVRQIKRAIDDEILPAFSESGIPGGKIERSCQILRKIAESY